MVVKVIFDDTNGRKYIGPKFKQNLKKIKFLKKFKNLN